MPRGGGNIREGTEPGGGPRCCRGRCLRRLGLPNAEFPVRSCFRPAPQIRDPPLHCRSTNDYARRICVIGMTTRLPFYTLVSDGMPTTEEQMAGVTAHE